MTEVWFSKPVNRLSWRAGLKGMTRGDAVSRAEANLEGVRSAVIKDIDDNLRLLNKVFSNAAESEAAPIVELYQISDTIFAMAGVFGLDGLSKGAFSLCELLSEFEASGCWWSDPVKIHIDAMHILRRLNYSEHENKIEILLGDISYLSNHFRGK